MAQRPSQQGISTWSASIVRRARKMLRLATGPCLVLTSGLAIADDLSLRFSTGSLPAKLDAIRFDMSGPIGLLFVGLAIFSATIAVLHVRARRLWNDQFESQRAAIADLQIRSERAALFLGAEPQFFISWDGPNGKPEFEGNPRIVSDALDANGVLVFSGWLAPADAESLHRAVEKLRADGAGFRLQMQAASGRWLDIEGHPVSGRAVMRLRDISGERLESIRYRTRFAELAQIIDALKSMLDAIPQPVWLRDPNGRLTWVNMAYVQAVEAKDADDVCARNLELLERTTRDTIQGARAAGQNYRGLAQAVVAGDRRSLEVVDVLSGDGASGGIATDVTELEAARRGIERQSEAHVRTLDQLSTAVALFDDRQRLAFFNRAFQELWQLDAAFVEGRPTDMEMLDRLRSDGKLPEQSDFREWKLGLQQSIHANETLEDIWHLPSGRALRVVTNPSASGVTYLFDDVTEQMHLATSYNRLANMQGETLDSLTEGVAVFGSNGRLQLFNPAFANLWGIQKAILGNQPHIDDVARLCPAESRPVWDELRAAVCGLPDERVNRTFETKTAAGKAYALGLTPLPEGASLLTVEDVTSTVNAARMLSERNRALEAAARLRSEFIHNVSFELRMPLTSVVGIAQLLATGTAGPLNERQRGYATDLMRATDSVLALIDDILDLASIEQSNLDLKLGAVDLRRSIEEATAGLKDRFGGANVKLIIRIGQNIGPILGDDRRIRQILFNLLANAVAFADQGDSVVLTAENRNGEILLAIADRGSPSTTGDPISADTAHRTERGQSLRLAIVKSLVELHRGRLIIERRADGMRQVTCILPGAAQQLPQRAVG